MLGYYERVKEEGETHTLNLRISAHMMPKFGPPAECALRTTCAGSLGIALEKQLWQDCCSRSITVLQ